MTLTSRAGDFLSWWWEGLLLALPERWAASLRHVPDIVTVEAQGHLLTFKLYDGAEQHLREERAIDAQDISAQAEINHWLDNHENAADLILLIPPDKRLTKNLTYPLASEKDLRAVLGHDMDKQTPFTTGQVYFDYTIARKDRESGKLRVDLHLVLKKTLRDLLGVLSFLTLRPKAAAADIDTLADGINFLPVEERPIKDSFYQRVKLTALFSIILILVALYLPLARYNAIAKELERDVGENRTQAMQAQTLIDRKRVILERADFLQNQVRYQTPFIRLLHEVTRSLPDDTWLTQFIINEGQMQIRGETIAAASVIRLIEQSDYFENAEFRSPVTKSSGGTREEFHITARLEMK